MENERLEEIRGRWEKATEGPWVAEEIAHEATPYAPRRVYRVEIKKPIFHPYSGKRYASRLIAQMIDYCEWTDGPANADFLAHSWQDIRDLLGEVERLRLKLSVAEAIVDSLGHPVNSPCGHSSQYAYSEDGGKNISCLICSEVALREDRERLDWLDTMSGFRVFSRQYAKYLAIENGPICGGKTLREAIDAARGKEAGRGE